MLLVGLAWRLAPLMSEPEQLTAVPALASKECPFVNLKSATGHLAHTNSSFVVFLSSTNDYESPGLESPPQYFLGSSPEVEVRAAAPKQP